MHRQPSTEFLKNNFNVKNRLKKINLQYICFKCSCLNTSIELQNNHNCCTLLKHKSEHYFLILLAFCFPKVETQEQFITDASFLKIALALCSLLRSGVARLSVVQDRQQKCRLFYSSNLLTEFKINKNHVSSFLKVKEIIKQLEHQNQTLTNKKNLYLIVDYESCFFCLSPTFSQFLIPIVSAFFTCTMPISSNIPPC